MPKNIKGKKSQKILIDHSLFIFNCVWIGSRKNPDFTFRTDTSKAQSTLQKYSELLKRISQSDNFEKDFGTTGNSNLNSHSINEKDPKISKLLTSIFEANGKNEKWFNNFIYAKGIRQLSFGNGKSRLVLLKSNKNGNVIIQPLFIDVNHMLYKDEKFQVQTNECMICRQTCKCYRYY